MIFENILALTLAEAAAAQMTGYGSWTTLIMLAIVAAVFYFFLYRPQKKQEAETNKIATALKSATKLLPSAASSDRGFN